MHEAAAALAPLLGTALGGAASTAAAWFHWRFRRGAAPLRLGARAPAFEGLRGADGERHASADFRGARALVVVFMSNRCPGVKAYDARLRALHAGFAPEGVAFVGINPVNPHLYPSESLPAMTSAAQERGLAFPYLQDATQEVARSFGAVCTPQVFVLDADRRLRYRGRIDDAFVPSRVRRAYLREALDDVLAGRRVRVAETAPLGCAIPWLASDEAPPATPAAAAASAGQ